MTDSEFKFPIDIHIEPIKQEEMLANNSQPTFDIEEIGMGD